MVDHNFEIIVAIDDKELREANEKVENLKTEGTKVINFIDRETKKKFRKLIIAANGVWSFVTGMLDAMGVSISAQFQSLISSAISTISVLQPILTAESVTPGMSLQAAFGLANLRMAIEALIRAQSGEAQIAQTNLQISQTLHGVMAMTGALSFL